MSSMAAKTTDLLISSNSAYASMLSIVIILRTENICVLPQF